MRRNATTHLLALQRFKRHALLGLHISQHRLLLPLLCLRRRRLRTLLSPGLHHPLHRRLLLSSRRRLLRLLHRST